MMRSIVRRVPDLHLPPWELVLYSLEHVPYWGYWEWGSRSRVGENSSLWAKGMMRKRRLFLQVLDGLSRLLLLRLLPTSTLLSIPACQAMGCWNGNWQVGLCHTYRPVSLIFVIDRARCDQPGHLPPWSVANKGFDRKVERYEVTAFYGLCH